MLAVALSRHAHPEKKRHELLVSAAKAMSLARIRTEGRPREGKVQKRQPRVYYVQATLHARQRCLLYLRWLYLYLCSSDLTVHERRGAWVLPRSSPAKKRVLDINGYLVSKAPGVSRGALALAV